MAMKITDECTECGLCTPECPTTSIEEGTPYIINPDTCNECEDQDEGPQCVAVCPVECIEKAE
jgi:ferredoxin